MATLPSDAGLEEEIEDLKEQQEQIRQDQAAKAQDIDAATAETTELTSALQVLSAEVNEQAVKVASAEQALIAAQARHDAAVEAMVTHTAEIADLEVRLSEQAISSFVNQTSPRSPILEEADPNKAVVMQSLVLAVSEGGVTVAEDLRRAKEDLEIEQAEASNASGEAERITVQLQGDLAELERRQTAQADLVAAAEERLERSLAEAWALEETDKELSASIASKNKELQEQLAAQARATQTRNNPAPSNGGARFPSANEIVNVNGIWVHEDISENLRNMMAASAADGIVLSGGGYRDSQSQIRLRRAHCGTSDYAVYRMPASQCRPPTARPGASMHEQGKAIDFRFNNQIIGTRNNSGYRWLAANAAQYGFYNLPSEPWHWSINGR
ncbi:MAG: D-alanyl-D-alanine carboxypeptidase family protein [Actinomycetota bacterium]